MQFVRTPSFERYEFVPDGPEIHTLDGFTQWATNASVIELGNLITDSRGSLWVCANRGGDRRAIAYWLLDFVSGDLPLSLARDLLAEAQVVLRLWYVECRPVVSVNNWQREGF